MTHQNSQIFAPLSCLNNWSQGERLFRTSDLRFFCVNSFWVTQLLATLPETNIAPQKETSLPTIHFQGLF